MEVGFTIDGPRALRTWQSPALITLARHWTSHTSISRCSGFLHRGPELGSLADTSPFTRAVTLISEPIYVPRDSTSQT
jgi:hypothetical protein